MIAALEEIPRFTPAEYLAWEEQQAFRYEYVDGAVYGMTGGSLNHSQIAMNFGTLLNNYLSGRHCRVLNSDAKVQISESNAFLYPDISVTCDERDRTASQFVSYPCLIVEVLSPSTEAYDRGDKFGLYRLSPSLQEYVLVSTYSVKINIYRRNSRNRWEIISYAAHEYVELESLNLSFPIEQIYENIIFETNVLRKGEAFGN